MSYVAIQNALVLLGLPFIMDTPTIGDGNCFFNAIIQQLQFEGNSQFSGPLDLRHALIDFIANSEDLRVDESFVVARNFYISQHALEGESVDAAWARLLHHMGRNGVWAEDLFISYMSQFLKRKICLTSGKEYYS